MSGAERANLLGREMETKHAELVQCLQTAALLLSEFDLANARLGETMGELKTITTVELEVGEIRAAVNRANWHLGLLPHHLAHLKETRRRMSA